MNDFSVRYSPEEDIIRVEILGEFDAQMLSASSTALAEELQRSACTRVLMDHRKATPKLSLMERYTRPEVASGLGVPKSCRIALVHGAFDDQYGFVETVGMNRGWKVKTFKVEEEALEWLRKPFNQATFLPSGE